MVDTVPLAHVQPRCQTELLSQSKYPGLIYTLDIGCISWKTCWFAASQHAFLARWPALELQYQSQYAQSAHLGDSQKLGPLFEVLITRILVDLGLFWDALSMETLIWVTSASRPVLPGRDSSCNSRKRLTMLPRRQQQPRDCRQQRPAKAPRASKRRVSRNLL